MSEKRSQVRMIGIVPGLAIPEYMDFILNQCKPIKHTLKAVSAGDLLKIDYHPPYLQLKCTNIEEIIEEARRRGLRIYKGRKHITITDGIYQVRIYL